MIRLLCGRLHRHPSCSVSDYGGILKLCLSRSGVSLRLIDDIQEDAYLFLTESRNVDVLPRSIIRHHSSCSLNQNSQIHRMKRSHRLGNSKVSVTLDIQFKFLPVFRCNHTQPLPLHLVCRPIFCPLERTFCWGRPNLSLHRTMKLV